jgi:glycosyltransferase A (GT-A) superfamily protein (DUF2064 family)
MAYFKKLGIFIEASCLGNTRDRAAHALSAEETAALSLAFIHDLSIRLSKLKKTAVTLFYPDDETDFATRNTPERFSRIRQEGASSGERLHNAFRRLLAEQGDHAVMIGACSPDVPLPYVKRAFLKLKHKDVVLGPSTGGGYYLIGSKSPAPPLFDGVDWGDRSVLERTIRTIEREGLSLSLLPLWYEVRDLEGLSLLCAMMHAKAVEKSGRLPSTERVLKRIFDEKGR